jgi:hypothetical protein
MEKRHAAMMVRGAAEAMTYVRPSRNKSKKYTDEYE